MKILTIVGARPQFIKAATVSRAIRAQNNIEEVIIHTGQHFDPNMSKTFFEELEIPRPKHNLQINGLSHGAMTGRMLEGIETHIHEENPDWVLVYGDTNSTLAGALAAAKLNIRLAHVEAGLRSSNPFMPEEINRILTDRLSSLLLCPTETAVKNLQSEGFPYITGGLNNKKIMQKIVNVGDVMLDAANYYRERAEKEVSLEKFGIRKKHYILCTLHRQENTDNPTRMYNILASLREIAAESVLVMPLHPRTKIKIEEEHNENALSGINIIDPLSYLEMQRLQMDAKIIITDSGGLQKEAFFHKVPCITLREETEWIETLENGANKLVGFVKEEILKAIESIEAKFDVLGEPFGDGSAAEKIIENLNKW